MSIYTDMVSIINERGLQRLAPISNSTGKCCLLGARALALGVKADADTMYAYDDLYSTEGIEELIELTSEEVPDAEGSFKNNINSVWYYNDVVIGANKKQAIEMLERAETLRVLNEG